MNEGVGRESCRIWGGAAIRYQEDFRIAILINDVAGLCMARL